jgi:hypothetical protein
MIAWVRYLLFHDTGPYKTFWMYVNDILETFLSVSSQSNKHEVQVELASYSKKFSSSYCSLEFIWWSKIQLFIN